MFVSRQKENGWPASLEKFPNGPRCSGGNSHCLCACLPACPRLRSTLAPLATGGSGPCGAWGISYCWVGGALLSYLHLPAPVYYTFSLIRRHRFKRYPPAEGTILRPGKALKTTPLVFGSANSVVQSPLVLEMSPLKRKSPDASPDASGDDAPNKRLKTEDEHAGQNGANKQENPFPSPQQSRAYDSRSPRRESVASLPERDRSSRSSFSQEEKKRGKRLFGGLLNTLSQTTSNSQQKRRQEVEKRQQERAAKQRTEDDNRRSERLAKLDKIRRVEQVRFDEQVVRGHSFCLWKKKPGLLTRDLGDQMRTRHSSMRSMAHSLQSKSEPKLVCDTTSRSFRYI